MFWLSSEPIRVQEITYPDQVVARTDLNARIDAAPEGNPLANEAKKKKKLN